MSSIRVTYSGLIAFVIALVGVVTGTIFVIMVTRKLSPEEFGLWTLIGSIVGYVTIVEPIVTYWTTRQIARGEKVGKTALSTSGFLSIGGVLAYFGIAIFISYTLGTDLFILFLASLLIPTTFVSNILNSICMGHKPQAVSYGLLSFEISKIPLGVFFVVLIPLGIVGALIATIGASVIKIIVLLWSCADSQLVGKIDRKVIKFWFSMSWLTIYQSAYGLIYKFDVLIFSLLTTSLSGLAYWGVAAAVSNLIVHSRSISQGLYPKIIATGKKEYAVENLKRTLYFGIPLLGLTIVLAKPILYVLNPIYVEGFLIAIIISFRSFVNIIFGFFLSLLEAKETIDSNKQATFKQYIKSNLFLTPTIMISLSGIYVITLLLFLVFRPIDMSDIQIVTSWSLILLGVTIAFMIMVLVLVKKRYDLNLPYSHMIKYSLVTAFVSGFIFYFSENFLTYSESVYDFIPQIIPIVLVGGVIYFGITYLIDDSSKILFKSIIKEIRGKLT